jgi:hypothetical protein
MWRRHYGRREEHVFVRGEHFGERGGECSEKMTRQEKMWFESMPGSQIFNSRPDPAFSFSFLELSRFERRKISNGSNRDVCNAPSFQAAFSTTV